MQKHSLPIALSLALKQHVLASDIPDDDELKDIVTKLDSLHEKIEAVKAQALANRAKKS